MCVYIYLFVCLMFSQTLPLGLGDRQLFTWTDGLKRKDWHDYESIQKDAMRSGIQKFRGKFKCFIHSFYIWLSFLPRQQEVFQTAAYDCSMSQGCNVLN